ncbi:hypothetical protein MMC31_001915 [Peltigera leucophlebia]|nr:hypothetical protein [Peltigera leucophlebia]
MSSTVSVLSILRLGAEVLIIAQRTDKGIDIIHISDFDRFALPVVDLEYRIQDKHRSRFGECGNYKSRIREGRVGDIIKLLEERPLKFPMPCSRKLLDQVQMLGADPK